MRLNIHEGSLSFYMVFPEIKYFVLLLAYYREGDR